MSTLLGLVARASAAVHGHGLHDIAPPTHLVGTWDGAIKLPDSRLPHVPLAANGYLGLAMSAQIGGGPGGGGDDGVDRLDEIGAGPGAAGAVDLWVGSNGVWACVQPTKEPPTKVTAQCSRRALGGVSVSVSPAAGVVQFSAEQHVASGTLVSRSVTSSEINSTLVTTSVVHPDDNVVITTLTWSGDAPVTASLSTWVFADPFDAAADTASSIPTVSRRFGWGPENSSVPIVWSSLATRVCVHFRGPFLPLSPSYPLKPLYPPRRGRWRPIRCTSPRRTVVVYTPSHAPCDMPYRVPLLILTGTCPPDVTPDSRLQGDGTQRHLLISKSAPRRK